MYTLTGQIIRQTPCQKLSRYGYVSMCAADNDSVIVSVDGSQRVYRISITTGQVLWESSQIYNNQYVLVASGGQQVKIHILDVNTGES